MKARHNATDRNNVVSPNPTSGIGIARSAVGKSTSAPNIRAATKNFGVINSEDVVAVQLRNHDSVLDQLGGDGFDLTRVPGCLFGEVLQTTPSMLAIGIGNATGDRVVLRSQSQAGRPNLEDVKARPGKASGVSRHQGLPKREQGDRIHSIAPGETLCRWVY